MAVPVLIIGKSGSGKSRSMSSCAGDPDWNLIRVLNKPLPFKGKINGWHTDNYMQIVQCLKASKANNIVIDDAGYLLTNEFMRGHSSTKKGDETFQFYNYIADHFWTLIMFINNNLPPEKIVYVIMHEEQSNFGDIKPKTIGKLLDDKVTVEGMFTIVLRCIEEGGEHLFVTQSSGGAVSKSPEGMFETLTIPNDIKIVEQAIRDYWELYPAPAKEGETNGET